MAKHNRPRRHLVALFVAAIALLNYPILALFDRPVYVFGIPLLVLYVHVVWIAIVVLAYILSRRIDFPGSTDVRT